LRGNKRRRSAEEEFLEEGPARIARVACRDRPAMIGYQKAPLLVGMTPHAFVRKSWDSARLRLHGGFLHHFARPGSVQMKLVVSGFSRRMYGSLPLFRSTQVKKSASDMKVVEVAVLKFLIHNRVGARRHQFRCARGLLGQGPHKVLPAAGCTCVRALMALL
jgi:hypothetical protein